MKGTTGRNSALLGVQWRFLSNDVARGEVVKDELSEAPFSDEAHRRITYLEKALVSQHDLDAQYQSFLQDAVQHAPGGSKCPASDHERRRQLQLAAQCHTERACPARMTARGWLCASGRQLANTLN